jgi:hypothetical protein
MVMTRIYKKKVTVGTGSSPTIFGGSGFAGLSTICFCGAEAEIVFLVLRAVFIEPLRCVGRADR